MKRWFLVVAFVITLIVLSGSVHSQDLPANDTSSVTVHKDPRLDLLVNKQAQINEYTSRDARRTGKGYRLMIISTTNQQEAVAAKTKIYSNFPELKPYLWHQTPYYKVKAGNFKDRKEAESYQSRLNAYFPKGVFVISDIIEMKPDKNKDEEM